MSINLTVVIDNEEAVRKFKELQKTAKTVTSSVITDSDRMDAAMRRIATTLGQIGVGASLVGLVKQIVQTRGEFQQLEVAFTTLLQSKEKADALMAQMVELAAKTPFDLQGVASGARQLLAYGFAAEDVTDVLTRLGNVAAGLGLNLQDLTWLYGTTAVQGRLYTRDVMQFQSRGIDLAGELATMLGKTRAEISQMVTEGKIGFPEVQKAIENMTNEGGKFYNLMQEQSKTITGLISNLGDAIDVMFNDIGKSQEGVITDVLKGTISLVENYQKVLDILIPLVSAYGAYKAALIGIAAAQRVRTTIAATQAIWEQSKALTAAARAGRVFNTVIKANPLGLFLSIVSGVVAALSVFVNRTDELNRAIGENEQAIINEGKQVNALVAKLTDANTAERARKEALEQLRSLQPEIVRGVDNEAEATKILTERLAAYNEEQVKRLVLARKNDELSAAAQRYDDARAEAQERELTAQKQIEEFQARINSGRFYLKDTRNKRIKPSEDAIKEYAQQVSEVIASDVPITEKAASLINLYDPRLGRLDLDRERYDLSQTIRDIEEQNQEVAKAKLDYDSTTREVADTARRLGLAISEGTGKVTEETFASLDKEIKATRERLAALKKELKELQEGIRPENAGKDFTFAGAIESKNKEIKTTEGTLATLTGYDPKQVKKTTEAKKKLSDQVLANDMALEQSRIDIMREGKAKELAEIDLRTRQKLAKIDEEQQKLKEAQGTPLTEEQENNFEQQRNNIRIESIHDKANIKLKYAKELDSFYKQITDAALTEEERRIRGIKDKYEGFREWLQNAFKAGNIDLGQLFDFENLIDRSELAESLQAVVDEYGGASDKIAKISQKAENARKAAREGGRMDLISQIDKQEIQEIGKIKADELMKTDDWINLFQNLDALSSKEIRRIIDNINAQLKNADLDPINLKTVTDQLQEASDKAAMKNPFAAVVTGFRDYKTAMQEAIRLREKYNQTQQESDRQAADQAELEAIIKKQKAWQNVAKALDAANAVTEGVSSIATAMGADEDTVAVINDIAGAVGGAAQAVAGFASGDIAGGIRGVFSFLTSAFSLFSGDRRHERNIKRLQDQIDALQKSYEDLGDAIENAYSYDASSMILQQNEMIDQQLKLIEQQIAEEKSKKNPDEDALEAYYEQMDELRKQQEKNKELAKDAIFGEDIKSAINNFANAYADAWAAGEDRAKSMKDVVKNMIKNVVIDMLSKDLAKDVEKLRAKLATFLYDGFLDPTEEHIVNDIIDDMVDKGEKYDPILKKYWGTEDTQNAASKGFQAQSQDTGNELNGRFSDMQGKMNILVNGMDMLRSINMDTRNATFDMRDIMIQLNGNVADIRTYTRILPEMAETLTSMNRKLDNL